MGEALAYPFLFLAIFFECFILVTLLSHPARQARKRSSLTETPTVAVIVPCWNEAETIGGTVESLLSLDYPKDKLEIILVNDGSTDATASVMEQFQGHPQIKIIHKENGGKHTALNAGIALTQAEFIGCLDADSFVEPDALRHIIPCFSRENVAAVTGAIIVHEPKNILQRMQHVEYFLGITFRHVIGSINGLYVTPGPFSFYRRTMLHSLGGFRRGHQTEDMEMALRIHTSGHRIKNTPHARVYTKVPRNISGLIRQRTRWTSGFLRNILGEYRNIIGNKRYGVLGVLVLPSAILGILNAILIFGLAVYQTSAHALAAAEIRAGIPLSYSLVPHRTFDWFYIPTNLYLPLGLIALSLALSFAVFGKHITNTGGNMRTGLALYLLFGAIAPFWLLRAVADVLLGRNRTWK